MPSRSRSSSPEIKPKKSKHRHRSRSNSPRGHSKHKADKKRHHDRERSDRQRHKDKRKERKVHDEDARGSREIKTEPVDRGYEKYAQEGPTQERRPRDLDTHRHRGNHRQRRGNRFAETEEEGTYEYGQSAVSSQESEGSTKPKEQPNFELSGKLTEDTNSFRGVVIKYNEPPEARKPRKRWRLYPFKGNEALPLLHIHRQSAYLLGRDRLVADIPVDHPSCSKQHAVLQFRMVEFERDDGTTGRRVRPYIIDLGSTNGTYVNNNRVEAERYVELLEKDTIKFGYSSREYVILHENTVGEPAEDEGID